MEALAVFNSTPSEDSIILCRDQPVIAIDTRLEGFWLSSTADPPPPPPHHHHHHHHQQNGSEGWQGNCHTGCSSWPEDPGPGTSGRNNTLWLPSAATFWVSSFIHCTAGDDFLSSLPVIPVNHRSCWLPTHPPSPFLYTYFYLHSRALTTEKSIVSFLCENVKVSYFLGKKGRYWLLLDLN